MNAYDPNDKKDYYLDHDAGHTASVRLHMAAKQVLAGTWEGPVPEGVQFLVDQMIELGM